MGTLYLVTACLVQLLLINDWMKLLAAVQNNGPKHYTVEICDYSVLTGQRYKKIAVIVLKQLWLVLKPMG